MADILNNSAQPEVDLLNFVGPQSKSRYTIELGGLAGRYKHLMTQTFWHDLFA